MSSQSFKITKTVIFGMILSMMLVCIGSIEVYAETKEWGNYEYRAVGDEAQIVSYKGAEAEVTIPSVIEGLKVTVIGKAAFKDNKSIRKVVVPDTVVEIRSNAFNMCESMESIKLSNTLKSIDDKAFEYCRKLQSLDIPDSVTQLGTRICYMSGIKSLHIGEGITTIPVGTFKDCGSLRKIEFPSKLIKIEGKEGADGAFANCYELENLEFPTSLKVIGAHAFSSCNALKSVVIPEGVTTIGTKAFEFCDCLISVEIPKSVVYIGGRVFLTCLDLKSIVLKASANTYAELDTFADIGTALGAVSVKCYENCDYIKKILADSENGKYIKVVEYLPAVPSTGLEVDKTVLYMNKYDTYKITAKASPENTTDAIIYDTLDERVAIVDADGIVKAVDFGTTTIKVTTNSGVQKLVTVKVLPSNLTGLKLDMRTQNTIGLKWNRVSYATGYGVFVYQGGKYKLIKAVVGNTIFTYSGLKSGTLYKMAVRPYVRTASGKNVWSAKATPINVRTAPGVTSKIVVSAKTKNAVKITWSAVSGAVGYRVFIKKGGKYVPYIKATKSRSTVIKGLRTKTGYALAVRAYTVDGGKVVWSPSYKTIAVKTR